MEEMIAELKKRAEETEDDFLDTVLESLLFLQERLGDDEIQM